MTKGTRASITGTRRSPQYQEMIVRRRMDEGNETGYANSLKQALRYGQRDIWRKNIRKSHEATDKAWISYPVRLYPPESLLQGIPDAVEHPSAEIVDRDDPTYSGDKVLD